MLPAKKWLEGLNVSPHDRGGFHENWEAGERKRDRRTPTKGGKAA